MIEKEPALWSGWGLWWWEDFALVSRTRRKLIGAAIVAMSFFLSILLIGSLAQSSLGLVDENDLPQYVGSRGSIAISDIPRIWIEKTEAGDYGQSQRYRPVYFLLRVTEAAFWGLDGRIWYRWRIAMFGIIIAAILWVYTQMAGLVFGGVLTLYTLSLRMWVDIWTRSTGPAEQYAIFGTALYAVGACWFVQRWRENGGLLGACATMALGATIAMGAKENMLLLEVPLFATLVFSLLRKRIGSIEAILLLIALTAGLWVASSLVLYFLHAKLEDIYGNSPHVSLLKTRAMMAVYAVIFAMAGGMLTATALLHRAGGGSLVVRYFTLMRTYIGWAVALLVVFLFNEVFYSGQIPTGIRYDFPAMLVIPGAALLLLRMVSDGAGLVGFRIVVGNIASILLLVAMLISAGPALYELPRAAAAGAARNSAFEASLSEAGRLTREHPDWPIYVKSFNYLDFEPIQALAFFFIARAIDNPRYLIYVANPYGETRTEFQTSLEQTLISESRVGYADRGYLLLPAKLPQPSGECFVLVLRSGAQFASDKAAGKDPAIGDDCVVLPGILYWDGPILRFSAPASP